MKNKKKNKNKKNHPGLSSILKTNQDDLLKLVAQKRDTGIPINARMLQLEATRINCAFCNKHMHAKKSIVARFLKSNALPYHKETHESKKAHPETKQQSIDFIDVVCPIVNQTNHCPRFIYNCDQSGFFSIQILKEFLRSKKSRLSLFAQATWIQNGPLWQ